MIVLVPVHMVHDMEARRDVLVERWLSLILRHVVEEVDVREGPARELICVRSNLKGRMMMIILKYVFTFSIISLQLLCFLGTITSSTSSRAIQSYLIIYKS